MYSVWVIKAFTTGIYYSIELKSFKSFYQFGYYDFDGFLFIKENRV